MKFSTELYENKTNKQTLINKENNTCRHLGLFVYVFSEEADDDHCSSAHCKHSGISGSFQRPSRCNVFLFFSSFDDWLLWGENNEARLMSPTADLLRSHEESRKPPNVLLNYEFNKSFLKVSAWLHIQAPPLLRLASHLFRSLQHLPLPKHVSHVSTPPGHRRLCFPVVLPPLQRSPSTSLLPLLISSIKEPLSGLCQRGLLTTPGIVTLWEFAPFKVFLITFSSLFLSSFLSPFCFVFCLFPFFLLYQPCFVSLTWTHTHTHTTLSTPRCIVPCQERRGTSCVVKIQACHQQTWLFPEPWAACLFLVFL